MESKVEPAPVRSGSPPPEGPPRPPRIPAGRKLARLAVRAWPFVIWCAALAAAAWLYRDGPGRGPALAMEEIEELKVSPTTAGRLATVQVAVGQHVRPGDVLAMLDAREVERRLRTAKEDLDRSRARLADCLKDAGGPAGNGDPRLLPFEQDLRAQEARVADLEAEERKLQILAPVSGTVSRIFGHSGEWKTAGGEVLVLLVSHPERRTGYISERLISSVGIGTPVTLRPRDLAGPPLKGRVIELGPQIEPVPARLRAVPGAPEWGRRIVFEVKPAGASLPGQLYDVGFH